MVESAEGIGSRKWSLLVPQEPLGTGRVLHLMQGGQTVADLTPIGLQVKELLATAPELWDAANDLVRQREKVVATREEDSDRMTLEYIERRAEQAKRMQAAFERLANMVAKAVGKTDWKDVLQA
jgi:hypothetical protein